MRCRIKFRVTHLAILVVTLATGVAYGQTVVTIGPPEEFPGTDHTTLQTAIDNNPGGVVVLSEGKYRLGYRSNGLLIPHETTIVGQTDASGKLLTTIEAENYVFLVNSTEENAADTITIKNLNIVSKKYTAIAHTARNRANQNEPFVTGGGNVLIENCTILAKNGCYQSVDVDGVSITIKDSKLTSKTNAISILNSSFAYLTIANNEINADWTGCLLLNLPWSAILTTERFSGPANIANNTINATKAPNHWAASVRICIPTGKVWIRNNVLNIGSGFGSAITWHNDASLNFGSYIVENEIIGSDTPEFKYVTGMEFGPFASLEYSGNKVQVFRNTFRGYFQTGVLLYADSRDNIFVDNDFSGSQIKKGSNSFTAPSSHWAMVEYYGLVPQNNTVMDNSGMEQTYVDSGVINDFQGSTFLEVPETDLIERPNLPI